MKLKLTLFFCFLLTLTSASYAVEPLPDHLINLSNPSGLVLLKRDVSLNTVKLLSHFTTQKTVTYCGVASVVMILNSSDRSPPLDSLHPPYRYFNQDDFFNDKVKAIIAPESVLKTGITLAQLNQIIQSYGLKSQLYFSNELTLKTFRETLKKAMSNQKFIIVNFLRSELKEQGGGHHSPLAAYDQKTDRFLLLDVARYKYPAYWVKTEDLWKAVHTKDGDTYRGLIVIG